MSRPWNAGEIMFQRTSRINMITIQAASSHTPALKKRAGILLLHYLLSRPINAINVSPFIRK